MKAFQISPKTKVSLEKWDPDDRGKYAGKKEAAIQELLQLNNELNELQELLFSEQKNKVLVVLQGMDTSGKDGVIRRVFEGVNPQGVKVASFKVPTLEELSHDYLWRIHKQLPGKGEIVIFNRSHYEDVLVVRVHNLVAREIWSKRYKHILQFERMLADEGTIILKFFLYISLEKQKERLQDRLDDPKKQWKFNVGDLKERKLWSEYMSAYEDALNKTSTDWAPWYVIPANYKWYRDLIITKILVEKLKSFKMSYPQPAEDLSKIVIE